MVNESLILLSVPKRKLGCVLLFFLYLPSNYEKMGISSARSMNGKWK